MDKRGQTGGQISAMVFGVAFLIIGVLVALVVVTSISGADLLPTTTNTVYNESGFNLNTSDTNSAVAGASESGAGNFVVLAVNNGTAGGVVESANYTIGTTTGILATVAGTSQNFTSVNVSYSYTLDEEHRASVRRLEGNYTTGIDNISARIPTVFLILAVVLVLAILILLLAIWQRTNFGGTQI